MFKIAIIASGDDYQQGAALSAATYATELGSCAIVRVYLPLHERTHELLRGYANEYGFEILPFELRLVSPCKYASQLKCQGFRQAVADIEESDYLLLADADTVCVRPIELNGNVLIELSRGKIAMVPDIEERHIDDPELPWFIAPMKRRPYVNSGVIFTGKGAMDIFDVFEQTSRKDDFLTGPYNDQKVINCVLSESFGGRLIILEREYNAIYPALRCHKPVIVHVAGGVGSFDSASLSRRRIHRAMCLRVLNRRQRLLYK